MECKKKDQCDTDSYFYKKLSDTEANKIKEKIEKSLKETPESGVKKTTKRSTTKK
jgi:mRNA-degrading endonuclease RelE of RelBE toxin-antitoxin system